MCQVKYTISRREHRAISLSQLFTLYSFYCYNISYFLLIPTLILLLPLTSSLFSLDVIFLIDLLCSKLNRKLWYRINNKLYGYYFVKRSIDQFIFLYIITYRDGKNVFYYFWKELGTSVNIEQFSIFSFYDVPHEAHKVVCCAYTYLGLLPTHTKS